MSWLVYLLQVNLALVLCGILYYLAFKQLTFFHWNRFYLLGSVLLSLLLPLLKLQIIHPMEAVADFTGIDWVYVDHLLTEPVEVQASSGQLAPGSILLIGYILLSLILLIYSLYRNRLLFAVVSKAKKVRDGRVKVYVQEVSSGSFTVFRRIYMNRDTYEQGATQVLKHERVHAAQLHSLDLLLMEFVIIIAWFNPFVFLLLRNIRENHEYLADEHASDRRESLVEYLSCLKSETIRRYSPAIASSFKCSTIKKRIIMLTNKRSNRNYKWLYLGILPLIAGMIALFHTSPDLTAATVSAKPELFLLTSATEPGAKPSLFPLSESYRERISWAYMEEAIHPISKELSTHLGVDIPAPVGTPVYATAGGTVKKAEEGNGWGLLIILDHGEGYSTRYAHLDGFEVKAGDRVTEGQRIGRVGNTGKSTGPHLHYEVLKEGKHVNPADYY